MLNPRLPVARPLALCLWLGSVAAVGIWGCQGPDTFLRTPGGGTGTGGLRNGVGGNNVGVGGGHVVGVGGTIGTGGASVGTGGRVGTGGAAAGGMTGSGGITGTGGTLDGGVDAPDGPTGTGGMIVVVDANTDVEGGGTGPCAGLCAPATQFVDPPNYGSPSFKFEQTACYETLSPIRSGGCSNCAGRTNLINGTPVNINAWPNPLGPPVRGGYCIQISTGTADGGAFDFASFYTYN